MPRTIVKLAVALVGAASILTGLVACIMGMPLIDTAQHYRELHGAMRKCAGYVRICVEQTGRFPSKSELDAWRKENSIPQILYVTSPYEDSSHTFESRIASIPIEDFRIACFDLYRSKSEFYREWDGVASTNAWDYAGIPACYTLAWMGLSVLFYRIRGCLRRRLGL